MNKVFVDSNLVVYTMDDGEPAKRDRCCALLASLRAAPHAGDSAPCGVVSTQVLQETYVVATRKLGVDPLVVRGVLESVELLEVVTITQRHIHEAIDCSILNSISFWDALLIAAATSASCDTLWTEDLSDGQVILGVRIENPLRDCHPQIHTD